MAWFRKKSETRTPAAAPRGGMDMTPMVEMLAGASEEQRRTMLRDRMAVFASQDDDTRLKGMSAMLKAGLTLPADDYTRIASSRLGVLMELEPQERMKLMQTHAVAVKQLDDTRRAKEMSAMKAAVGALPADRREMVMGMMKQLGMMP